MGTHVSLARWLRLWWALSCTCALVACATPQRTALPGESAWAGRLALTVDTEPVQSVTAGFDLRGSPASGTLLLTSPLGNTVASVQWNETGAEWRQGDQLIRRSTLDELTTELGGTALPVAALFRWLDGQPAAIEGWQADLSRYPEGRITARRSLPLPSAHLRLILQP